MRIALYFRISTDRQMSPMEKKVAASLGFEPRLRIFSYSRWALLGKTHRNILLTSAIVPTIVTTTWLQLLENRGVLTGIVHSPTQPAGG